MSEYMLMFSLGPVQPFIAQARKTRDLWLGSLLFSKLMEAAMMRIEGKFIFPGIRTVNEIPDVPNKYVVIFDDLEKAQAAAAQSKEQIMDRWRDICNAVWEKVINGHGDEETQRIWGRQTNFETLFDTYWVIVKRKEAQDYSDWLEEAEGMFAARKRLRDFKPDDEPGEKSAISGDREILRRKGTRRQDIQDFWKAISATRSENDLDKEGEEHLDAIDLVKRFAMEAEGIIPQKPFPSTSSVATASFIEGLLAIPLGIPALAEWREATNGKLVDLPIGATKAIPYLQQRRGDREWLLRRDGGLYFLDTFTAYRLKKEYNFVQEREAEEKAKQGQHVLRQLLNAADKEHISRPTPYYATIQMDGDNMGILLSGVKGEKEHEDISKALSRFSRETALDLVEKQYPARLVYAGGDDVLAFAPLARDKSEAEQPGHVLELVDMLQTKYREKVIDALPQPQNKERMEGVSASMGIVIAHHFTSLSYVLRSAREAESAAKKHYGKDALVVTVIRRSGEQTQVGCHWRYDGLTDDGQPLKLFSKFYTLFKSDILSPKCVYILLEEVSALVGLQEDVQESVWESEIRRVLLRQYDKEKDDQGKEKANIPTLAKHLAKLAGAIDNDVNKRYIKDEKPEMAVELHSDKTRYGLVETLGWLLVMAFLARKEQE